MTHFLENGAPISAPKLCGAQKTLFKFSFSVVFQQKHVEIAISDFIMHLINWKWLRIHKCRQKRKTMRREELEAKEKISMRVFSFI